MMLMRKKMQINGMRTNIITKIIQTHTNTIEQTLIILEVLFILTSAKFLKLIFINNESLLKCKLNKLSRICGIILLTNPCCYSFLNKSYNIYTAD